MCGICGIINLDKSPVETSVLERMNKALIHRGPDDEGRWIEKNIGLAQRRLSIIDLSPLGRQPMFFDKKNLAIVFNGEIYNYIEIRKDLIDLGYKFRSQSDTEVILASYKEWGIKCLERFNGMWALVIYDRKNKLIFAARDRIGVKPFYYFYDKKKFLFASEIKAILKHPEVKAKPDDRIVWDYLVTGLVDHHEDTFFENIKELRAGKYILLKNNRLKVETYWDLDPNKPPAPKTDQEIRDKFRELFIDSVKLRLRSDVPIGTCLSGGLDSSAIVCVVNNFLKKEGKISQIGTWQKTFSAAYEAKKFPGCVCDEREFINEVVRKTKVKSHLVFPSGKKLVEEIKDVVYHQDYPFGGTSIYAQWNVFRLAKHNGVKVMLDGQGSDELLAGYHPYFGIYFSQLLRDLNIPRLIYEVFAYSHKHERSAFDMFKELLMGAASKGILGSFASRFVRNRWPEYELFKHEWRNKYSPRSLYSPTKNVFRDGIHTMLKSSITSLLRYEDRDSMAFGIESRVPFLDYRLIEFVYSLADNQKIRHGETKWVMRQALKGILPEKIRNRQDKIGFATPETVWLKQDLGKDMRKVFASEKFHSRGYFEKGMASKYFEDVASGKNSNYQLFWRLYNYEMWMRVFID